MNNRIKLTCIKATPNKWVCRAEHKDSDTPVTFRSPFTNNQEGRLRWYLEKYATKDPFAGSKASGVAASIKQYAHDLFEQLQSIVELWGLQNTKEPLDLHVQGTEDDLSIHKLHWEALEHPSLPVKFCVTRVSTPVSANELSGREAWKQANETRRLLFVTSRIVDPSNPEDFISTRLVLKPVLDSIASMSKSNIDQPKHVNIDIVRPGTFTALKEALNNGRDRYDIVHFDVHGQIKDDKATLLFMSDIDRTMYNPVDATDVAHELRAAGVDTVILNSCNSANATTRVTANLAITLLQSGISSVLGMSYQLHINAATIFMLAFYRAFLVEGHSMEASANGARRALRSKQQREARFQYRVDVEDWLVPVLYRLQDRSQDVRNDNKTTIAYIDDLNLSEIMTFTEGQKNEDERRLFGRESSVLDIENQLLASKGVLLLEGSLGCGKTSLILDSID
ncbi:uncharacterized protein LY89DRAFT_731947 [Mollisia scopiformis]|uniref:CHAT domain-containing protein n=1 Tax=Mollisia scopiformis TaxID=149040 RepID=A0A194XIF8_MOLSC|nr:uncharacterized protein LY89DRAFT_731947 [Mollisia scopiformis]KUJ19552.1 hypothetical protein LY89DRAFT_731947 [Mollisia scopiformis]